MSLLESGKVFATMLAIICILIISYFYNRGRKGIGSPICKIPALDAIDEAVNRATEMGRPVHISPGRGTFERGRGLPILAGLEVCIYTATICARTGIPVIFSCGDPAMLALAEERLRAVYTASGQSDEYYDSNVSIQYYPRTALNLGILQILEEENVGATIWVGYFGNEAVYLAEQGSMVGAMQVAGTISPITVAFMVPSCDYTLICEEVYAAGAYLSEDPRSTSDIGARDYMKLTALALICLLTILSNLGIDIGAIVGL